LSLVDRLFLLTHDPGNGKPLASLDVLGIGLAGAALLELTMMAAVSIKLSGEVVRTTPNQVQDEATNYVLIRLYEAEPQNYPVIEWIGVLRNELYLGVAGSLAKRGIIDEQRSALRGSRYLPRQRQAVEESMAWVYRLLQSPQRGAESGQPAVVLACLVG